jgi:CBS domain-containing protein
MQVSEVMTREVECIRPEATVQEAAAKMKDLDVGVLPVCENDQILGMITDRDIVLRSTADGSSPLMSSVQSVMTPGVVICHEDDSVEEAARLMSDRQIRRLVVLGADGHLAGILSLGDLAVRTEDNEVTGEALESISEPAFQEEHPTI